MANQSSILPIVLSSVSLVISMYVAIRTVWMERFHIDFRMVKWFGVHQNKQPFFLWLSVVNYSKTPFSITEIRVVLEDKLGKSIAIGNGNGKLVASTRRGDFEEKTFSLDYPITVSPYGSIGGYFHVYPDEVRIPFEDTNVAVTLITNRGTKKKQIYLDYGKNVLRVLQHGNGEFKMNHSDGTPIILSPDAML